MTGPNIPRVTAAANFRQRLFNSQEWRDLVTDYKAAMVERALKGSFSAAEIVEISRDLKGLEAFLLWAANDLHQARKAGYLDGRQTRTRSAGKTVAQEGGTDGSSGDG
jgi:hypothetical protein